MCVLPESTAPEITASRADFEMLARDRVDGEVGAYNSQTSFTAPSVGEDGQCQGANDATCLEETIGSCDELSPIRSSVELKICEERRLACECKCMSEAYEYWCLPKVDPMMLAV